MDTKDLEEMIREVPDFPKPGIKFKDITPLLKSPEAFEFIVKKMAEQFKDKGINLIASAESRGFILGAALANEMKTGFVPLRKPGKLPYKTIKEEFELEYGKDAFEIHIDSIKEGDNVLIVDDVLATGGTMKAATSLVHRLKGNVSGIAILIELVGLDGRKKIKDCEVYSLMKV